MPGLEALEGELRAAAQAMPGRAKQALDKTLADITADGQAGAPVDTGFLRSSIGWESHATPFGGEGEAGPTAAYGGYVENGTSRQAPQPYMEPAADRRVPLFEDALAQLGERM